LGRVHKAHIWDRPLGVPQMQIADESYRIHPGRTLNQGHHESSRHTRLSGTATHSKVHRHSGGSRWTTLLRLVWASAWWIL